MKKTRFLFTLLLALAMVAISPQKAWALGGSGTSGSPYTIANAADLVAFANKVNGSEQGAYAKLTANITLSGTWTAMGTSSKPYTGTFDGQGHKISGFSMEGYTKVNAGFFGYVKDATIKNFTLNGTMTSSTQITSGENDCSGAVVGRAMGSSTIQDIVSNVNITLTKAQKHLGGVVGAIEGSTVVKGCTYTGTLDAGPSTDCIGGIVGFAPASCSGSIFYCFFNGTLSSSSSTPTMGGILGYTNDESNNFSGVHDCYSCGTFSFDASDYKYVNAIVGRIRNRATTTINNTYLSGKATRACNTDGPSIPASNKAITITLNAGTGGKVTQTYVNPSTEQATQLKLEAAATTTGYYFTKWDDNVTTASRTEALTGNITRTANFDNKYTITVATNSSTMGTVSGGGTFDYNSTKTITATPKTHYHFEQWNDGNTNASRTITVTGDKTYTATFAIDQHTITVATNNSTYGTVSGGGTFDYGSTKTITATPNTGYHFVQWNDGVKTASRQISVTGNATYTATFAIDQHTITVNVASGQSSMGTVTGGGTYDYNSQQTIKATAETHYHFVKWNDGDTNASRTITVTENKTYTATFAPNQHTITVKVAIGQSSMGTVSGGGTYDYNSQQTISATPKPGYDFVKWDDGNTDASRTITVTKNWTYTAMFEAHTFGDWITDIEPTCTAGGTKHRECTHDGCNEREYGTIGIVDHTCSDFDANGFGECSVCHGVAYQPVTLGVYDVEVENAGQLCYIAQLVNDVDKRDEKYYQSAYGYYPVRMIRILLTKDIVFNDGTFDADGNFTATGASLPSAPRVWIPIGTENSPYEGYFNGNGHTISGLYINDAEKDNIGLIGYRTTHFIENVGLINCYFKGRNNVGGLVGADQGSDEIRNCSVSGYISGSENVGGICGNLSSKTLKNCWTDCVVTATVANAGGICGVSSTQSNITGCYSLGAVAGPNAGSICGYNQTGCNVSNCFSSNATPVVGKNDGTVANSEQGVTPARFASGEITWRLNGNTDGTSWYQNLSDGTLQADAYPVSLNTHRRVYHQVDKKCDGTVIRDYYTNVQANTIAIHQPNGDGSCTMCGSTGDVKVVLKDGVLTFCKDLTLHEGKTFELNTIHNYPGWSPDSLSITKAVFDASFASVRPTSCYYWFGKCRNMTSIEGIENLNTEEVMYMANMFRECRSLKSIDLSHFNTDNVTEIMAMFYGCTSLESIDLSNFTPKNVERTSSMFRECSSLKSVDLSNMNTESVGNTMYMFSGCSSLETITLGKLQYINYSNTSSEDGYSLHMFDGCDKLTTLNIKSIPSMTRHPDFKNHPWTTVNYLLDDNSYVDQSYYDFQMPAATSVHYTRALEAGKTVTFILPFDTNVDNINGKVYELTDFDGEVLTFTEPADGIVHAHKPYLLRETAEGNLMKAPIGSYTFDIPGWAWFDTNVDEASMSGTYITHKNLYSTAEESIYGYSNGELVRQLSKEEGATQGATIKPFRALIRVKGEVGQTLKIQFVDKAGNLTASDVIAIRDIILSDSQSEEELNKYDLNNDDEISVIDLTKLVKYLNAEHANLQTEVSDTQGLEFE